MIWCDGCSEMFWGLGEVWFTYVIRCVSVCVVWCDVLCVRGEGGGGFAMRGIQCFRMWWVSWERFYDARYCAV